MGEPEEGRLGARSDKLEKEGALVAAKLVEDGPQVPDRRAQIVVPSRVARVLAQIGDVNRRVVPIDQRLQLGSGEEPEPA
eukprot:2530987-Pleurochrysis_carterae.AAC.2